VWFRPATRHGNCSYGFRRRWNAPACRIGSKRLETRPVITGSLLVISHPCFLRHFPVRSGPWLWCEAVRIMDSWPRPAPVLKGTMSFLPSKRSPRAGPYDIRFLPCWHGRRPSVPETIGKAGPSFPSCPPPLTAGESSRSDCPGLWRLIQSNSRRCFFVLPGSCCSSRSINANDHS